jgi:hypothetical protein
MPRRTRRISREEAISHCAWCRKKMAPDEEIFSIGARAKPWVELPEGGVLELSLDATHRRVLAVVTVPDSPAHQSGNDLLFATCSQACAEALTVALQKQIDLDPGPGMG